MATTATAHWPRAWCGLQTIPVGVDPDAPAMLYLVRLEAKAALGLGVLGARSNDLDDLESLGWQVVQSWWFDLGFDALEVEEGLIDRWRNLFSLEPRLDLEELLGDGSTTAVTESPATEHDAIRYVDRQWRCLTTVDTERSPDADALAVGYVPDFLLAAG